MWTIKGLRKDIGKLQSRLSIHDASHGFFGSPDAKVLLACLRPPSSMENNLIVWSCEFLILDIESRVSIKFIFNVLIRLMFVSHIPLF